MSETKTRKKYRWKSREEAESAAKKIEDDRDMYASALQDVLNGWTGTDRGGNPVKFTGHWHGVVAMRPESCSGGFILLIRNKNQSSEKIPRKIAEVYTPAQAKEWQHSLCRGYDSTTPDAKERSELLTLLAKAINALPYA